MSDLISTIKSNIKSVTMSFFSRNEVFNDVPDTSENTKRILLALPIARQLRFAATFWRQGHSQVYARWNRYLTRCVCDDISAIASMD